MFITISRQLGAGESTILPLLAQRLGWRLVDQDALEHEAESLGPPLPEAVDERLEHAGTIRRLLEGPQRCVAALKAATDSLVAQGPCILVGRGAAHLYAAHPDALHVRLVAPMEDRIPRIARKAAVTPDKAREMLAHSDTARAGFHQRLFHRSPDDPLCYHLIVNTGRPPNAVEMLVAAAQARFNTAAAPDPTAFTGTPGPHDGWRFVAITRQYGAGGGELAELVGAATGWPVYDRALLHASAELSGVPEPQLLQADEHGPDFLGRLHLLQTSAPYFAALQQAMARIREDGPAIVVGRGSALLLSGDGVLRLRLVAGERDRVEQIMRRRWLAADAARSLMAERDRDIAAFHRHYFRVDGTDPLLFHLVLNTSLFPMAQATRFLALVLAGAGSSPGAPDAPPIAGPG